MQKRVAFQFFKWPEGDGQDAMPYFALDFDLVRCADEFDQIAADHQAKSDPPEIFFFFKY